MHLHFFFFNTMFSAIDDAVSDNVLEVQDFVFGAATQLHSDFGSSNNASTEHLSSLHL